MKKKKKFRFPYQPIIAAILVIITLFPIYWLVAMSIRDSGELLSNIPLVPRTFTLEHFTRLFTEKGFDRALKNSLQVK